MKILPMESTRSGRYNIRVLDRAIRILSVLSNGQPRTLTELNEETGLNTSTTFRLLATLATHHYVERDELSGKYSLGLACLELARAYHKSNDLRRQALPELERLRDEITETVHLAVLNEMEVIYLEKLPGSHAIGMMSSQIGGRAPAFCTGLGRVMLAYADPKSVRAYFEGVELRRYTDNTIRSVKELMERLEQVRAQGYALDKGEYEIEVRCVAAPIFDLNGQVIAAISVSGPASRMEPLETNRNVVERTVQAAQYISTSLGYRQLAR